jgi:hypothetical protein
MLEAPAILRKYVPLRGYKLPALLTLNCEIPGHARAPAVPRPGFDGATPFCAPGQNHWTNEYHVALMTTV